MNKVKEFLDKIIKNSELIGEWNKFFNEVNSDDPKMSYWKYKVNQLDNERKELYDKIMNIIKRKEKR